MTGFDQLPGQTKKLQITVDGKPVYSGTPWHYDIYADGGVTHVAVLTTEEGAGNE